MVFTIRARVLISILLFALVGNVAKALEPGHYVPGIANIRDFAVPQGPGFYYTQYNAFYSTDTYRDRNGNSVDLPNIETDVDVVAVSPLFMWVTEKEVWRGRYAFYIMPSISKASVNASISAASNDFDFDDAPDRTQLSLDGQAV